MKRVVGSEVEWIFEGQRFSEKCFLWFIFFNITFEKIEIDLAAAFKQMPRQKRTGQISLRRHDLLACLAPEQFIAVEDVLKIKIIFIDAGGVQHSAT